MSERKYAVEMPQSFDWGDPEKDQSSADLYPSADGIYCYRVGVEVMRVEYEDLLAALAKDRDDYREQFEALEAHLEEIHMLDPDWHEVCATEAGAMGDFDDCVAHHDAARKALLGVIAGTHVIVEKEAVK